jgi:sensor histidine kinase YesM
MGIALENIRKRLGMMCAGKLDVVSHHEGGTTVIVTIPDQKEENDDLSHTGL